MNSVELDFEKLEKTVNIDIDRLILIPITKTGKRDLPSYVIIDMDIQEIVGVTSDYGSGQYISNITIDNTPLMGSGDTARESVVNAYEVEQNNLLHDNRNRFGKFLEYLKEVEDLIQIKGK